MKTPYHISTDVRFNPLELIDVKKLLGVLQGEFHWHKHDHEDEFFYVLDGKFVIDLDGRTVELKPQQG